MIKHLLSIVAVCAIITQIFLHPTSILAEILPTDTTPTTSPAPEVTTTPTPLDDVPPQSVTDIDKQNTQPQEATVTTSGLTPTPTPIVTTESETQQSISNTNEADIEYELEIETTTGNNVVEATSGAIITTGDIEIEVTQVTEVNSNTIGTANCQIIMSVLDPQQHIDLSQMTPEDCADTEEIHTNNIESLQTQIHETEAIQNVNDLMLDNTVTIAASTGDNTAQGDDAIITTGDIDIDLNIFTVANTNIIGNNTFFGIITIFDEFHNNIYLPDEFAFLQAPWIDQTHTADTQTITQTINNQNNAAVTNDISVHTDTGQNTTPGQITTGDTVTSIDVVDLLNTNINTSRFFVLQINNYNNWTGGFENLRGEQQIAGDTMYITYQLPQSPASVSDADQTIHNQSITNQNNAVVQNTVDITATTGHNQSEGQNATLETGDIAIEADIVNMINTNIIGSNWFYMVLNLMDIFGGDIVFAERTNQQEVPQPNETETLPQQQASSTLYTPSQQPAAFATSTRVRVGQIPLTTRVPQSVVTRSVDFYDDTPEEVSALAKISSKLGGEVLAADTEEIAQSNTYSVFKQIIFLLSLITTAFVLRGKRHLNQQ